MTEPAITVTDVLKVLEVFFNTLNGTQLEELATDFNLLKQGGFRSKKIEMLRAAVLQSIRMSLFAMPLAVMTTLREILPIARFVALLSEDTLVNQRSLFMTYFQKAPFILALLVDCRETTRTLAKVWMEQTPECLTPEETKVRMEQLFSAIGTTTSEAQSVGALLKFKEQTIELKQQLITLQAEQKRERQLQHKLLEQIATERKAEQATYQFNLNERDRKIALAENGLAKEIEVREKRVADILANRQISLFQSWLKPYITREQMVENDTSKPLLTRVEDALKEQAAFDRASQSAAKLEENLRLINEAIERTQLALNHAIQQSPVLKRVQAELLQEKAHLEAQLGHGESTLGSAIANCINRTETKDSSTIMRLLQSMEQLQLLSNAEVKDLKKQFDRRASLWQVELDPDEKDVEICAESEAIIRRNPTLTKAFNSECAAHIFLDGHNMLLGLGRYKRSRGVPLSHEDARKRMEQDIIRMFKRLPLVIVDLVWDGETGEDYTLSDNVLGHYSGGKGEHKADKFILDHVKFCIHDNAEIPCIVVTDDQGFSGAAKALKAETCKLHDFEAYCNAPAF